MINSSKFLEQSRSQSSARHRGRPPAKRKSYDHVANGRPPDDLHLADDRPPGKSLMITWRPAARQETYDDHDFRPQNGPRLTEDRPPGKSLTIMWRPAVSQVTLQMGSRSTIYGLTRRKHAWGAIEAQRSHISGAGSRRLTNLAQTSAIWWTAVVIIVFFLTGGPPPDERHLAGGRSPRDHQTFPWRAVVRLRPVIIRFVSWRAGVLCFLV